MRFKKGQIVWEAVRHAKPVICGCCGQQKYLSIHPDVCRYKVVTEFISGYRKRMVEVSPDEKDSISLMVFVPDQLFVRRADAIRAAKNRAKTETIANRRRHKELVADEARLAGLLGVGRV